jgi:hypothetical protein
MFVASIYETGLAALPFLDSITVGLRGMHYWYTHLTPTALLEAARQAK